MPGGASLSMARQDSIARVKAPSLDELVLLPEMLAVQRQFDARNYRFFRWLLGIALLLFLPAIGEALQHGWFLSLALFVGGLLSTMGLIAARQTQIYETYFRQILIGYLFFGIIICRLVSLQGDNGVLPLFALLPFVFFCFRLRLSEELMLFGTSWLVAVLPLSRQGWFSGEALPKSGEVVVVTVFTGLCLVGTMVFTQVEKRRFLAGWRKEHSRARERERMREEIDTARRIQLSMLPQSGPNVTWIDMAAASLPATEVGGDYYEYFRLSSGQLSLVIGDVAGHGLASGLLLSGVRSCLYLLEDQLTDPVAVLDRLNHMVRRTTDKRTYMTLLCAVLERDGGSGTLTLASAGHPPVLHYSARAGRFETVGQGAPPLGTFLDVHYETQSCPLLPRDLLVFYTDGLVEARNAQDHEYGDARLERAVARVVGGTARDVRDAILGDLSNFKGDAEQFDDITVVVARIK
jgi:serine phosphatase RsbU (regulator of sigma subunit)